MKTFEAHRLRVLAALVGIGVIASNLHCNDRGGDVVRNRDLEAHRQAQQTQPVPSLPGLFGASRQPASCAAPSDRALGIRSRNRSELMLDPYAK